MENWDASVWVGIVAIIATVAGIIIGAFFTWKHGNRRGKAAFSYSTTPLISYAPESSEISGDLEVRYKGNPVIDPHMTTLNFAYAGPSDIRREQFDNKSIVINMNTPVISVVGGAKDVFHLSTGDDSSGGPSSELIEIPPRLIKKDARWDFKVLTSGKPNPEISDEIADVDTESKSDDELSSAITSGILLTAGTSPTIISFFTDAIRTLLSTVSSILSNILIRRQ